MHSRLYDYFDKFHLLNSSQLDFRKNHSTYMSLLLLRSAVSDAIDFGDVVLTLFLDLQKAFDTVNHHLLLHNSDRPKCPAVSSDQIGRQRREVSQASGEKSVDKEQIPMCLKEERDFDL